MPWLDMHSVVEERQHLVILIVQRMLLVQPVVAAAVVLLATIVVPTTTVILTIRTDQTKLAVMVDQLLLPPTMKEIQHLFPYRNRHRN